MYDLPVQSMSRAFLISLDFIHFQFHAKSAFVQKVCPNLLSAEKLEVRMSQLHGPNQIGRISIMK